MPQDVRKELVYGPKVQVFTMEQKCHVEARKMEDEETIAVNRDITICP